MYEVGAPSTGYLQEETRERRLGTRGLQRPHERFRRSVIADQFRADACRSAMTTSATIDNDTCVGMPEQPALATGRAYWALLGSSTAVAVNLSARYLIGRKIMSLTSASHCKLACCARHNTDRYRKFPVRRDRYVGQEVSSRGSSAG